MQTKIYILLLLGTLIFIFPPESLSKVGRDYPSASITQYGYYEFTHETVRFEANYSPSGYAQKDGEPILIEQTSKIPLKKGRLMAFYFKIKDLPTLVNTIKLTIIIDHPEFNKPDGSISSQINKESLITMINGQAERAEGYKFDHDNELVEGKWVFTIKYLDKVLLVKEFETYLP